MSITRTPSFDPFRRAMNDVFDSFERDMLAPWGVGSRVPASASTSLAPAHSTGALFKTYGMDLDFHETAKGYELVADLPGMSKEDIAVDVDRESGVLTVTGERKNEREETGDGDDGERKYHFVERSYGKTTRSIRLPETADTSKASADYANGVLTLNFPKLEAPTERRLQIPIGGGAKDEREK